MFHRSMWLTQMNQGNEQFIDTIAHVASDWNWVLVLSKEADYIADAYVDSFEPWPRCRQIMNWVKRWQS